jgi:endo-1,4-beta-xylanase
MEVSARLAAPAEEDVSCNVENGDVPQSGGGSWTPTPDPGFVPGGAVHPTATPIAKARGTGKVAALTFDDGPNPGDSDRLLDILAAHRVRATFCVVGRNIEAPGGADVLQRIVAQGHTLGNHGTTYADLGAWTHAQVEADLKENLAIIRAALGDPDQAVPYFRAPNGSWGVSGEVASALGMQPLGLGNLISDWDGNDLSEETLVANLRNAFEPGAVVLVHDGGGNRASSVGAVEEVLPEKVAEGWVFTLPSGGIPGRESPPQTV